MLHHAVTAPHVNTAATCRRRAPAAPPPRTPPAPRPPVHLAHPLLPFPSTRGGHLRNFPRRRLSEASACSRLPVVRRAGGRGPGQGRPVKGRPPPPPPRLLCPALAAAAWSRERGARLTLACRAWRRAGPGSGVSSGRGRPGVAPGGAGVQACGRLSLHTEHTLAHGCGATHDNNNTVAHRGSGCWREAPRLCGKSSVALSVAGPECYCLSCTDRAADVWWCGGRRAPPPAARRAAPSRGGMW